MYNDDGIEIYNNFPEGLNIAREWEKGKINDHLDIPYPFFQCADEGRLIST